MNVRDLSPEEKRSEILSRWDAAVRVWWSDRDIDPMLCDHMAWRVRYFTASSLGRSFATPEAVAHGA